MYGFYTVIFYVFPYEALVTKKKICESCMIHFVAGSLAVFGELPRKVELKKITLFTVCALCLVCVD